MRIFAAASLLFASALAFADSSVPNAGGASSVMVTFERTACFGRCPIYKLSVLRDGTVLWEGERFVKTTGKATAKLDAEAQLALAREFKRADFFALHDKYDRYDITDHPSAIVSFDDGKRKKTIHHYHGDGSAPQALYTLEDSIDRIVGTARWIGKQR